MQLQVRDLYIVANLLQRSNFFPYDGDMEHASPPIDVEVSAYCPVFQGAVELVGRRWTAAIVRSMLAGSHRFSEILARVPGLSDRLLSERLRELEAAGIVDRTVYPETPVRIEYGLTPKGRELRAIFLQLSTWAEKWHDAAPPHTGH